MHLTARSVALGLWLSIGLVGLGLTHSQKAAAQTPTAQQMEAFRNLPPDQQQKVLEQMGVGSGASAPTQGRVPATALPTSRPKAGESVGTGIAGEEMLPAVPALPRLRAGDSLLLAVELVEIIKEPPASLRLREQFQRRLLDGNPYQLDRLGRLELRDSTAIVLAGLTAEEAAARLNADPQLQNFEFVVSLLPVEPELRPFGYDLFSNIPTTFAPATDIPVPANYVLGPGDTFEVQLIGERGGRHTLTVSRDGTVDFPQLGPVAVAGMRFTELKEIIEQRVSEQMIGLRANVTMGALRSIQVFVLGEAVQPGAYTVSGLSTMTHALFASGGVKPIGSLRDIQLKRDGKLIRSLDLYDLLLRGDTSNDLRLMPGDVIFIPPIGMTAAVSGEVQRPAIYEFLEGAVASDLLYTAGGLTPQADPRAARLERIDERRNRTVVNLDLTSVQGRGQRLQTGDTLRIQPIRESFEGAVSLEGHVHRPGAVQYRSGMRLTDLLGSLDELKPMADLHYLLIRRETGPNRKISVLSADAAAAFANPQSEANVRLQARDRVHVFDVATSRDRIIAPIVSDLTRQSSRDEPLQIVNVGGRVKLPGQYPLEPGMMLSGLLRAGGGLDQAAFDGTAELIRYEVVGGEARQTELIGVDLGRLLAGDASADVPLRPFDFLTVKEIPLWREQEIVEIAGEVKFPGRYPITRGETLGSLIRRAGGLTDLAFPEGSVFTREELKEREQRQLDALAERLQGDLAALSLQQAQSGPTAGAAGQTAAAGQQLLADLKATRAVGRLVIDLEALIQAGEGSERDVVLKDGDRLIVPRQTQEVTVIGEVQSPTSHLFNSTLAREDYVAMSGGMTRRADEDRIYVIRANGGVANTSGSRWFAQGGSEIRPGDTIVVPLDAERMRPLPLWTAVTSIIFNLAVAVAAVGSL